jgi:hypothetical protein
MAWSYTKKVFGVCGNFRYAFYNLTDIKATRSLIRPDGITRVRFSCSTNTTDGTDVLLGQTLTWTGQTDGTTANTLEDSTQVFDPRINFCLASNTSDNTTCMVNYKDADQLYCWTKIGNSSKGLGVAVDAFDTTKNYTIYNERIVQVVAGTANDDGTLLVIGD